MNIEHIELIDCSDDYIMSELTMEYKKAKSHMNEGYIEAMIFNQKLGQIRITLRKDEGYNIFNINNPPVSFLRQLWNDRRFKNAIKEYIIGTWKESDLSVPRSRSEKNWMMGVILGKQDESQQ